MQTFNKCIQNSTGVKQKGHHKKQNQTTLVSTALIMKHKIVDITQNNKIKDKLKQI